jgi:hypothetical protein
VRRELGFEERIRLGILARREKLRRRSQSLGEAGQDLQRGNALAGFDAREIGGGATVERQLPLLEAGRAPCLANPRPDGGRIVDVCRGTARHLR